MSATTDLSREKLMSWVRNGQQEKPSNRMAYGGVTQNAVVHLKTISGEVITYPLHTKVK